MCWTRPLVVERRRRTGSAAASPRPRRRWSRGRARRRTCARAPSARARPSARPARRPWRPACRRGGGRSPCASIPKRSSSPSVCAKSRAVTSTSSPRRRSASITGRMTSTCGEFVRSIQTRIAPLGQFAQVLVRARRSCLHEQEPHRRTRRRRLAGRRLLRLRRDLGPAASATVHPGVVTYTEGAQCTANFVFFDAPTRLHRPGRALLGHRRRTDTDGCTGKPADRHARRSHRRLAARDHGLQLVERDAGRRRDRRRHLRLQRLRADQARPADYGKVNPSVPTLGGPTGLGYTTAQLGDVYSYGNSSLRQGITPLAQARQEPRRLRRRLDHLVYTVTPGIPGDSGSGFMDAQARAFGVLSTLRSRRSPPPTASRPGAALAYMRRTAAGRDAGQGHASRSRARSSVEHDVGLTA